jgi:hypothetical protein
VTTRQPHQKGNKREQQKKKNLKLPLALFIFQFPPPSCPHIPITVFSKKLFRLKLNTLKKIDLYERRKERLLALRLHP